MTYNALTEQTRASPRRGFTDPENADKAKESVTDTLIDGESVVSGYG